MRKDTILDDIIDANVSHFMYIRFFVDLIQTISKIDFAHIGPMIEDIRILLIR